MGGLGTMSEPTAPEPERHARHPGPCGPKLPALQAYQLSPQAPAEPAGSFDAAAVARGKLVFEGADPPPVPRSPRPMCGCMSPPTRWPNLSLRDMTPVRRRNSTRRRANLRHQEGARAGKPAVHRPGTVPEVAVRPCRNWPGTSQSPSTAIPQWAERVLTSWDVGIGQPDLR